jgi:hypothetical protein
MAKWRNAYLSLYGKACILALRKSPLNGEVFAYFSVTRPVSGVGWDVDIPKLRRFCKRVLKETQHL